MTVQYEFDERYRVFRATSIGPFIIRFYETICLNRGWAAKVFYEYEEAMDWFESF